MAPRPLSLAGGAGVRRACAGAFLLALLAGCGGGSTAPHTQKGRLHGTVTRGPTSPVCRRGVPCSEPANGTRIVFTPSAGAATTVVVAKDGSYTVSLAAGRYTVTLLSQRLGDVGRGIEPTTVHAIAGRTRTVDFSIDTGLR